MGIQPEFSREIPRIFVRGQMSPTPVMGPAIQSSVRTGEGCIFIHILRVPISRLDSGSLPCDALMNRTSSIIVCDWRAARTPETQRQHRPDLTQLLSNKRKAFRNEVTTLVTGKCDERTEDEEANLFGMK
ncbi:hypothetical protein KEM48_004228 [Puccinia striiformis f. sp. tritici PST-130]|nr:hypothetical protein KEM48_004228 [Puccinia striiformis f. sp. tritici PST-130]